MGQDQLTVASLPALPDDRLVRRRSYVVVRIRYRQLGRVRLRVKVLREPLSVTSANVPATHRLALDL